MPTHLVNLDALIAANDFSPGDTGSASTDPIVFKVEELGRLRGFYKTLRKPGFQRETNNWTAEKIVEFVKSFLDNEMVPALILWESSATSRVFIIDGAHRLSALIAWVNDDYGDKGISESVYGQDIHKAQLKQAATTRALMESQIGSYDDLVKIHADKSADADPVKVKRSGRMYIRALPVTRVDGNADAAERAFLTINEKPAIIDKTELAVIRARGKPNTIAARALMRAGQSAGPSSKFAALDGLAKNIHGMIFGTFEEIKIDSTDVPRGGQPYSARTFEMLLNTVNHFNDISDAEWKNIPKSRSGGKAKAAPLADDLDGTVAQAYLVKVSEVVKWVSDRGTGDCLGLDQAVYYYGPNAHFYGAAFIAAHAFVKMLHEKNLLDQFTKHRDDFEEFMVKHKSFLKDLSHGKGAGVRSVPATILLYETLLNTLASGVRDHGQILVAINAQSGLDKLKPDTGPVIQTTKKRFSKKVTAAAILRNVLEKRDRCKHCNARLPPHMRSKDHTERKEDGGLGTVENLKFMHPYCNGVGKG